MDWLTGDVLAAAARNSSDWLRRIADPGVWVMVVFAVWTGASLVGARLLALKIQTAWLQRPKQSSGKQTIGVQTSSASSRQSAKSARGTLLPDLFEGRGLIPAGLLLILMGSAGWTLVGTTGAEFVVPWIATVGAILALLGVIALAAGFALRLRLQVNVVGPNGVANPVQASYVAVRMAALGSSRPRGLLFPHGTDASNLPENALITADNAGSKIAASILALLRILTAVVPWKAEVFIVDKTTAAVTLRRNGRQIETQLLAIPTLLPAESDHSDADSDRALLTGAAAFILFQLSRAYPKLGYGLAGAEHWQSVAAQVLATTPPWRDNPKTSAELFARAVDYDPKNLAAWLGFLTKSIGSYGSLTTLRRGVPRLQRVLEELNRREGLELSIPPTPSALRDPLPEEALRIRILRTLTVLTNNWRLLVEDPHAKQKKAREAIEYATLLMESVQSALRPKKEWSQLNEYAKSMQPLAGSLYVHVWKLQSPAPQTDGWLALAREWKPAKPRKTSLATLRYHYDEACALLEVSGDQGKRSALDHLELALALEELRYGAASDPSFKQLRLKQEAQFSSLLDNAPRIASLTALKNHSEKLMSVGIRFTSDLLSRNGASGDKSLAQTLQVPVDTIAWMRGVCKLADGCPDPMMAVDWTNLLTGEGIDGPQALHMLLSSEDQFFDSRYARIVRGADQASIETPRHEDLGAWDLQLTGTSMSTVSLGRRWSMACKAWNTSAGV